MIYTDLDALCATLYQIDTTDADQIESFSRLVRVYYDALQNPPYGVIGVGAITYAQAQLVAAQIVTP
jgi:hypothetical protein